MARTVGSTGEDTRLRIVAAATELFHERGYASTSIRHIAERLGMTKGALYYHFASKEELLLAIVAPLFGALTTFVDAVREAGTVGPRLVRELVDILDANAPLVRSLSSDPAVTRARLAGRGFTDPFVELERSISGATDEGARIRVRCALGLIFASVLGPPHEPPAGLGDPPVRLTELEKQFVTAAAIAVLAVPAPA
jgi:AcrR family transcriptional regulator